ncbi:MAG TPA: S1 RNA-binding domain-containing protein [Spirochaetales bacterium]|nr:S1 RNA-binding domain-containing protein [Spirochaetales bacterium]
MIPGKIVEINSEYVFLDVGLKSEGKIPIDEFTEPPEIGETVYVILISKESKRGEVIVSKKKADEKIFWKNLRQAFDNHEAVAGKIDKKIKGGYEVDLGNGLRAFMPQSKADISRVKDSEELLNLDTHFYVDRLYNKGKVNIVITRKEWLEDEIKKKKEKFFAKARIDDVIEGTVKSFTSFGAFIDLGGFDGLLHINDMSWRHITSPKDLVSLNDKLKLKLIRLYPEENKINLSLKHFTEDPWTHFEEKYQVGDVIKGHVTKLADFGAFIELEEGIEGLAHISELSWVKRIRHPKEVLHVDDQVEIKILNYDIQQGKLSLGIKQVYSNPWDDIDKRYPVGMRLTRKIKNFASFGAFLELEEGIDGLLHLDDMSWTKKIKHPSEIFQEGQEIEVSIIDVDKENRKIKLGIKQLEENPWKALARAFPRGSVIDGEITGITDFGIFAKVQGNIEGLINKVNIFDQNVETLEEALAKYKVGDAIKVIVSDIKPAKQKLALSIREYNRKIQQEEMVKYIHDDSTEEKSTLADFIKDKSTN